MRAVLKQNLIFILFLFVLFVLALRSQQKPAPFATNVAGYLIQFPITSKELHEKYPHAVESHAAYLTDTTEDAKVIWQFNNFVKDSKSQPYGVLITLKNKSDKLDSIRTAFENQYHQPFQSLLHPKHLGKYEYYESDPSLGVMQINDDVQLSISRRKIWPQTGYQFTEDVIVAICYNLSTTEKERFAMKQGEIRVRD